MRILITIILIMTTHLAFGQDFKNELVIKDFLNNLKNSKIDTVLVYENGTIGSTDPVVLTKEDSCFIYGETQFSYVIWRYNENDFITKLSTHDCYNYYTIQYDLTSLWNIYFENIEKIKKEKISLPQYIDKTDTLTICIDHYSYSRFMFINQCDSLLFEVSDFDLTKLVNGEFVNINYKHNKETTRNLIRDLIDNEIQVIENKSLITRQDKYK